MLSGVRLKQKIAPYAVKLHGISHVYRLSIVYVLAQEPMSVGDVVDRLKISAPLVSHHLKELYQSGWITKTKFGKLVTYYLEPRAFEEFKKFIQSTPFGQDNLT